MNRSKRLGILLAVLVIVGAATLALTQYEEKQEEIRASDTVIFSLSAQSVETLSWESEEGGFSFHREEERWVYDGDEHFPVSEEVIAQLLARYESFGASFIIENVDDYAQYGLDAPVCTITLGTAEESIEIHLGDFSRMDEQRYADIGDGNVYLLSSDPMDDLETELSAMIRHDEIPEMGTVTQLRVEGDENYTIVREEDSGRTYSEEDIYFAQLSGGEKVLESDRVEAYLDTLSSLRLKEYASYDATEEELRAYGLDDPAWRITLRYLDEEEQEQTVTLSLGQNREEAEAYAAVLENEEDLPEVSCYLRLNESQIIYCLEQADYDALCAVGYDDLRHDELFWGEFDSVTQIDLTLEGKQYTLLAGENEEERIWRCGEETVDIDAVRSALKGLCAERFTEQSPAGKEELSLTLYLTSTAVPQVTLTLYRQDGSTCLAVVDGETVALVPRSDAMDLVEAMQSIILN